MATVSEIVFTRNVEDWYRFHRYCIADIFLQTDYLLLISFGLFNLWAILDCVDGNIARSVKKEKFGDFLDAIAGYVYQGLFIGLLGFRCVQINDVILGDFNQYVALFSCLGALCSTSIILFNKKFSENSEEYGPKIKNKEKNKLVKLASRIWGEIGFGGAMPILVFVFYFSNLLSFFILIYSILSILLFLFGKRKIKQLLQS